MRTWDEILNAPLPEDHEARVSVAVAHELEVNRERAGLGRRWFSWQLVTGLGLLSVAAFGVVHTIRNGLGLRREMQETAEAHSADLVELAAATDHAVDFEVVADFDILEDLDSLEAWKEENV